MLRRIAAFLLVTLPLSSFSQQGQSSPAAPASTVPATLRNPGWDRVAALVPGEPIAVLQPGRRSPVPCRADWVDDASLACVVYVPYSAPRRTVYPIGNIAAVYSEETVDGPSSTALLLGSGIGGGIGAIVCSNANATTILGCAGVGGLIGLAVAATPHPTRYPPRPRTRLRLIYRAP